MSAAIDAAPAFLRKQPDTTNFIAVDDRLELVPLFRVLAEGGYAVVNDRTGRLVITDRPEDFNQRRSR